MTAPFTPAVDVAPEGEKFRPFWDGCAEGKILIPRCPNGHGWHWYPQPACTKCRERLVWEDVGVSGTVFSYSVVHRPFVPSARVPFTVGLIALHGAPGVRLVAQLGVDPTDGQTALIDQEVMATFVRLETHVLPVFELVR